MPEAAYENQVWFTTEEAAAYLRIEPACLRMRISRGRIKPDRLGGTDGFKGHRFHRETLDRHNGRSKAA